MKKKSLVKVVASLAVFSFVLATAGGQTAWAGQTILTGDTSVKEITDADDFEEASQVDDQVAGDYKADIGVNAKILEYGDVVYKIDISWGEMKFEYKNKTKKWDPENHEYVTNDQAAVSGEWLVDDYINGTNNMITVVNHSNARVDASFAYAHDLSDSKSLFNATPEGDDAVRGHFFLSNDDAKTAATVLEGSATVVNGLETAITLGHQDALNAEGYGGTDDSNGATAIVAGNEGSCERYVYFTFNGTPDSDLEGSVIADFTKAGTITVTITPTQETP